MIPDDPTLDLEEAASKEIAASGAVRDIARKVKALGASDIQAGAVAEAMRLVLLGQNAQARAVLKQADFPSPAIDLIVGQLEKGLKSAA